MKFHVKTKASLVICLAALLMSVGCANQPSAFRLDASPDLMETCHKGDFLDEMIEALDDAEGLTDIWLIEFAGEAEKCNINSQGLQGFNRRSSVD